MEIDEDVQRPSKLAIEETICPCRPGAGCGFINGFCRVLLRWVFNLNCGVRPLLFLVQLKPTSYISGKYL